MSIIYTVLQIAFMVVSIVLSIVVIMQEGKSAGLGAISGMADSYWGKNKGRSMEGVLVKVTRILLILFLAIAAVMNIGSLQA